MPQSPSAFTRTVNRTVRAVFGDLHDTAELLGSDRVLDELRACGRAVRARESAFGADERLRRAVSEVQTAIHHGMPLIADRVAELSDEVVNAARAYRECDGSAAEQLSLVQRRLDG